MFGAVTLAWNTVPVAPVKCTSVLLAMVAIVTSHSVTVGILAGMENACCFRGRFNDEIA